MDAESTGRSKVCILFPDDWATYSPTLVRLVERLRRDADVSAFVMDTGRFDLAPLDPRVFHRVGVPSRLARLLRITATWRPFRILRLARAARRCARDSRHIVAVDADGAWAATLLGRRFHFLSLEIARWSSARWLVPARALSITIQSQERLDFQFPPTSGKRPPVFLVQNAPPAPPEAPDPGRRRESLDAPRIVYMGNIIPGHGVDAMLALARAWPQVRLTLHGPVSASYESSILSGNQDLVASGRLELSKAFLADDRIPAFLAGFDIGICLYDLSGRQRHDFNYLSSPSGKMFNYFAAGLPVLASPVTGLSPVSEFEAGIQARSNEATDLVAAARQIAARYGSYREGARRAAVAFDFERSVAPLALLLSGAAR